jgi:hypothetical protein
VREELKTPGRSGRRGKSVREWLVLGTRSARGVALERTRRRARYWQIGTGKRSGILGYQTGPLRTESGPGGSMAARGAM